MPLNFNKACELEDFHDEELVSIMRDVCAHKIPHLGPRYPAAAEYNKDWEVAMAVRTLRHFEALQADSMVLGVAAGVEDTLFYLTRHARLVFATDRYFNAAEWSPLAPSSMLLDPAKEAPFEFDSQRLVVQHMDGRLLRFPNDTFDGIFSSGSIEHFGQLEDVAASAYEMGRVLKPGGVLSVSTVLRIGGTGKGGGFPGTLVMSEEEIRRNIIEASGLELVDDLCLDVSQATHQSIRNLVEVIEQKRAEVARRNGEGGAPEYALWEFPHLLLEHDGFLFDSVHLALRKPISGRAVNNEWAKPTPQMRASIAQFNDALLAQHAVQAELAARQPVEAAQPADKIDEGLEDIRASQAEDGGRPPGMVHRPGDSDGTWRSLPVALSPEVRFEITVDPKMRDPITVAYLSGGGDTLDDTLLGVMLNHVRPGDAVLDLGAFVGTFSLAAAAAGCRVLSLEASPHNASLLTHSAVKNGFSDLRVVHAAVLDAPGAIEFCPAGPWGHVATASSDLSSVKVFAVRVDDLLERLGWSEVAFVKMDVEGSEIRAIRGMARLLNGPKPPVVVFESNAHTLRFYGSSTAELLSEWESFGYDCYLLDRRRLIRTAPGELQPQTVANYLAVKGTVPSLTGWSVEPFMTTGEKVKKLVEEAQMVQEDHRANAAISLENAEPDILSDSRVARVLDRMLEDESQVVRAGAQWWKKSREKMQ